MMGATIAGVGAGPAAIVSASWPRRVVCSFGSDGAPLAPSSIAGSIAGARPMRDDGASWQPPPLGDTRWHRWPTGGRGALERDVVLDHRIHRVAPPRQRARV